MAEVERRSMVTTAKLGRIGDAIREKLAETTLYTLDEMPEAIRRISGGGPVPPAPSEDTYTVLIDITDKNPETWCTRVGDAEVTEIEENPETHQCNGFNQIDEFMGYYPVVLNQSGEEVILVDEHDYKRDIYGRTIDYAIGTNTPVDLFIAFPVLGYRIHFTDATHIEISITKQQNVEGYKYLTYKGQPVDTLYVSTAMVQQDSANYIIRSVPITASGTISYIEMSALHDVDIETRIRQYTNRNELYAALLFDELTFIECCAFIKYRGRLLQNVCGLGLVGNGVPNESSDTVGLNFGYSISNHIVKLFGIANPYGQCGITIHGLSIDSSTGNVFTSDGTIIDGHYDYKNVGRISTVNRYSSYPVGTTECGFLPSDATDYSLTTGLGTWTEFYGRQMSFGSHSSMQAGNIFRWIQGQSTGWQAALATLMTCHKLKQ